MVRGGLFILQNACALNLPPVIFSDGNLKPSGIVVLNPSFQSIDQCYGLTYPALVDVRGIKKTLAWNVRKGAIRLFLTERQCPTLVDLRRIAAVVAWK